MKKILLSFAAFAFAALPVGLIQAQAYYSTPTVTTSYWCGSYYSSYPCSNMGYTYTGGNTYWGNGYYYNYPYNYSGYAYSYPYNYQNYNYAGNGWSLCYSGSLYGGTTYYFPCMYAQNYYGYQSYPYQNYMYYNPNSNYYGYQYGY